MAALEMVVAQNRAAHNGQVRIGANKIMGELVHKAQQLLKGRPLDLHGSVPGIEGNAMLIIIDVGRVLQEPGGIVDGNGDDAVVLPGRMIHPTGVALVLGAKLTLWIAGLGGQLGSGDGLGVLFRLGQVNGNVQGAVVALVDPLHVPGNAVRPDVIGVQAQLIEPVRGPPGAFAVETAEGAADLMGEGGQLAHKLRVEQVPGHHVILAQAPGHGIVGQGF